MASEEKERKLYLRSIDRIDDPLEIPDSRNASHPFFSPTGKKLGFYGTGQFTVVDVEHIYQRPVSISTGDTIPLHSLLVGIGVR